MSKSRNKNRSELEYVRGKNKQLKSENRQLRRRVNDLEKRSHFYEEVIDDVVEDIDLDECQECGKGYLQVLDLKYIKFVHCDTCGYKERLKSDGKEVK